MAAPAEIFFPPADTRALIAAMFRASKALDIPLGSAVRMAGNMLGRTMATSTRVPKRDVKAKKRVVREIKGARRADGRKKFEVTSWRSGSRKTFIVFAQSKSDLNKSPKVKIDKYGLAKATWVRIASRIGSGGASGGATPAAKKAAARAGSTTFNFKGSNPFVTLTNELSYATTALQGGEQDVNTAMARAARGLVKSVEEQLRRKVSRS